MVQNEPAAVGEPFVGMQVPPSPFSLDEKQIRDYYDGLELDSPTTVEHAPTTLAPDLASDVMFSKQFGHLWLRQEWELRGGLVPGVEYAVEARVLDIYPRRNRTILLTETTSRDANGEPVIISRHHQSFLLDNHDGSVGLRDPKKKEGASTFSIPDGEPLTGIERTISLEMCGGFFHGNRNYHTDRDASAELGFEDVVVGGAMTQAYVSELLQGRFGDSWYDNGRVLVKFTNVVWPSESMLVQGVVTGPAEDDADRTHAFVWIEKGDGTIAIVADATVRE